MLPRTPRSSTRTCTSGTTSTAWSATTTSSSRADGALRRSRARSCSASTSPTGIRPSAPRTTGRSRSRARVGGPPDPLRAARPERVADRGGDAAASTPARAGSSSIRARRASARPTTRLGPVFELAAERGVPILIHGGRGLPPIAAGLRGAGRAQSRGDADHRPRGHRRHGARSPTAMAGRRRVFFDTSAWSPIDLLEFYRQVPARAGRSTPPTTPTGSSLGSLLIALLTAQRSRATTSAQLRGAARRQRGPDRRRRGAPRADAARRPATPRRSRCSSRASTSTCRWRSRCCGRGSPTPRRARPRDQRLRRARERRRDRRTGSASFSIAARDLWAHAVGVADGAERLQAIRLSFRLINLADIEAVTAAV